MLRRGLAVAAMFAAACQGVTPATTTDPAPPPSPTVTSPRTPDLDDLADRISPHRAALRRAGVDRYRFRSRVSISGSERMQATYEAAATVDPAMLRLVSRGMVGTFEAVLGDDDAWYRYPGSRWTRVDPAHPWRWNPGGPIYSYALAGVIAEMTLDAGARPVGRQSLQDRPTTQVVKDFDDGTRIEVWVSDEGVVMKLVVTEPVPTGGLTVLEWEIFDINGDFTVEAPLP